MFERAGMNITDTDIAASPAFYPHTFDAKGDRVMLVRMSAADYRLSSFLDSRLLAPGMTAAWFDYVPVAISAQLIAPRPLHMIFHTGHVGSTLLSRLLDEVPGVLGLREPHPLQTLADMADETQARRSLSGTAEDLPASVVARIRDDTDGGAESHQHRRLHCA